MYLETFLLEHFSYTVLFQIYGKLVIKNLFLLFEVITRENVAMQGMLVREHVRNISKWASKACWLLGT